MVAQCQPLLAPAAWFMEERAPDLTQRMLNEISASPTLATGADRAIGLSKLREGVGRRKITFLLKV